MADVRYYTKRNGFVEVTVEQLLAAGRLKSHGRVVWTKDPIKELLFDFETCQFLVPKEFVALRRQRTQDNHAERVEMFKERSLSLTVRQEDAVLVGGLGSFAARRLVGAAAS